MTFLSRFRWLLIAIALLGLGGIYSRAQNANTTTDAVLQSLDNQADVFFNTISQGQVDDAFDALLIDSPVMKRSSAMTELKQRTKELEQRFGRYRSHEQIASRRIGQDVVILRYLYKCENFPVAWYFTFYRTPHPDQMPPTSSWKLITLRFDTQIEVLDLLNQKSS